MSQEFEDKHPRDAEGQFTHAGVSGWAGKAAAQLSLAAKRRGESRPPGHAAAVVRARQLWRVPSTPAEGGQGRYRTDAEQDELNQLEQAFDTFRKELGLRRSAHGGNQVYADDLGQLYSEHGERMPGRDTREHFEPPWSLRRGYTRVGDHPDGEGRAGDPQSGGLWIDPANPGTRHAPRYLDDYGHAVMSLKKPMSRSARRKEGVVERRRGDLRGRPADVRDYGEIRVRVGGRDRLGEFGYGARGDLFDEAGMQHARAFVAAMKRAQPRARQETAREAVRRTPRGTPVDGWMRHVGDRIEQTHGRRV